MGLVLGKCFRKQKPQTCTCIHEDYKNLILPSPPCLQSDSALTLIVSPRDEKESKESKDTFEKEPTKDELIKQELENLKRLGAQYHTIEVHLPPKIQDNKDIPQVVFLQPYRLTNGSYYFFIENLQMNIPLASITELKGESSVAEDGKTIEGISVLKEFISFERFSSKQGVQEPIVQARQLLISRSNREGTGFDLVGQTLNDGVPIPSVLVRDVLRYATYQSAFSAYVQGLFARHCHRNNQNEPFQISALLNIMLSYCGPRMDSITLQKLITTEPDELYWDKLQKQRVKDEYLGRAIAQVNSAIYQKLCSTSTIGNPAYRGLPTSYKLCNIGEVDSPNSPCSPMR